MSRFFFHLKDFAGSVVQDEEGSEFPSLVFANEHALRVLEEVVADAIRSRSDVRVETIVVADQDGTHLGALPVLAALPPAVIGLLKHPETFLPANRIEEYRRNADECRRRAEVTPDPDDCRIF